MYVQMHLTALHSAFLLSMPGVQIYIQEGFEADIC